MPAYVSLLVFMFVYVFACVPVSMPINMCHCVLVFFYILKIVSNEDE